MKRRTVTTHLRMLKYVPELTDIVIEEIPDRVTLAVEISNCRGNCLGCHSPFLKKDIGEELTPQIIDSLIADNFGVTCFLFLGEGKDTDALLKRGGRVLRVVRLRKNGPLYRGPRSA